MPPPLCVSCRSLSFVSGIYIYVQYITAVLLSYVGKYGQDEAFHKATSITLQQKLFKKKTVWKNVVVSRTNHDIDMKILNNMKQSMAHIFVAVKWNASLWVQYSIFEHKIGPGYQDDG